MTSPFTEANLKASKDKRKYGHWVRKDYRHIKNTNDRERQGAKDVSGYGTNSYSWWIYEWCKIPVFNGNSSTLSYTSKYKR